MKNIDEINAKYNEICQAVDAVDWKLREFARLYDLDEIKDFYLRTQGLHDLLIEIGEQLDKEELL
jgi:hypothetical protein